MTSRDEKNEVSTITAHWKHYIESIALSAKEEPQRVFTEQEHTLFKSCIVALTWRGTSAYPNESFKIYKLQHKTSRPSEKHARQANKLLNYLNKKPLSIKYEPMDGRLRPMGYHDTS